MDACVVVHMHTGQLYDDLSRCEPSLAHNTVHVSVDEQIDFCNRAAHEQSSPSDVLGDLSTGVQQRRLARSRAM